MKREHNHILITLDSCRWDTFALANVPMLKSGQVEKCWTHATFTMAAHQAFFAGKLPHTFNGKKFFDTAAASGRRKQVCPQIWRLSNPESRRESFMELAGRNIKDGFRRNGYVTIGTGAMNWFDPGKPAPEHLLADFDHFQFFPNRQSGDGRNIQQQVDWLLERITSTSQPYFLFLNVGETHHPYTAAGHTLRGDWGDAPACAAAQRASLEFVDTHLQRLFAELDNFFAAICGDHGDCWGEDGLWGHGFYHPRVMEVPMVVIQSANVAQKIKNPWKLWPFRRVA
jgi:arylsulfatase A-like enzyme